MVLDMRRMPYSDRPTSNGGNPPPAPRSDRLGAKRLAPGSAGPLGKAVASPPEVRPDKVEKAKRLLRDPSYPSETVIRKISALLAARMGKKTV